MARFVEEIFTGTKILKQIPVALYSYSKPLIESVHSCRKEDNYVVCQVRPVDGRAQDQGDATALLEGGLQ